jgi:uncharacterized protein
VYHSPVKNPLQIIRRAAFTATPWKNGAGVTHEALRMPAGAEPFRWRVSVAHIEASGPFSDFSGYDRKMVLLRGTGLTLKFAEGELRELRSVGELIEFDGSLPVYCDLLNGACVDLNLMVSKSISCEVRVARLDAGIAVQASLQETTLVFAIEDPLLLESNSGETVRLEPWDLAVVVDSGARLNRVSTGNIPTVGSVFIATLRDSI